MNDPATQVAHSNDLAAGYVWFARSQSWPHGWFASGADEKAARAYLRRVLVLKRLPRDVTLECLFR